MDTPVTYCWGTVKQCEPKWTAYYRSCAGGGTALKRHSRTGWPVRLLVNARRVGLAGADRRLLQHQELAIENFGAAELILHRVRLDEIRSPAGGLRRSVLVSK